jgi:hypothetical protein
MVAESSNESVAETIAEDCNAAVVAYAKAVMVWKKQREATPKSRTVREPKELRAIREAEAKAIRQAKAKAKADAKAILEAEVKAEAPGDKEMLLRQLMATPAIKKAIKEGKLSLRNLKKDSYSRLLRRRQLLENTVLHNGKAEPHARSFVAAAPPTEVTAP